MSRHSDIQAQSLVNRVWETRYGLPLEVVDWSATAADASGNLYTAGNTALSNGKIALYLTKHDEDGDLVWEQTFNENGIDASYGIAVTLDAYGNVYVAGAAYFATHQQHDFLVVKYQNDGSQLWHVTRDGVGFKDDFAVALVVDAYQNVYVTGPSFRTGYGMDYLTLKIFSNGSGVHWFKRYDYAQLDDVPVSVKFISANYIEVTGGSAVDSAGWDIASVRYNVLGIGATPTYRHSAYGLDFEKTIDMTKDAAGNFYICGSYDSGAGDYDIKVLKLNSDLSLLWQSNFSASDGEDGAYSISLDDEGNIFVGGFSSNGEGGKDVYTMKLDNSGSLEWERRRSADDPARKATARKASPDGEGNLYLAAEEETASGSRILTSKYDPEGNLLWERRLEGDPGGPSRPNSIQFGNDGAVQITGITTENGKVKYTTVKYEDFGRDIRLYYDQDSIPRHVEDEVVIRFAPSVVDSGFVNDGNLRFGRVDEVITDSVLIAQMDSLFSANGSLGSWTLVKIFDRLNTRMTVIQTTFGETIPLPKLWSAFILIIGESALRDPCQAAEELTALSSPYIYYAHPNSVFRFGDPWYPVQSSLHNTGLYPPGSHINVEPAWNLGAKGNPGIKVGVFDSGIQYTHEDFGHEGGFGGVGGSIVDGGWDFGPTSTGGDPVPIYEDPVPDVNGHGTNVAGIIAALRNNDKGIKGIAGGDMGENMEGVHLYSFKILNGTIGVTTSENLGKAFEYAMTSGPEDSPLTDIINNSWGGNPSCTQALDFELLRELIYLSYKAGIILCNNRGNDGNDFDHFPATYPDEWGLSIGASGVDGKYKDGFNHAPEENFLDDYRSSFGLGVDIIAPGSLALTFTTHHTADDEYVRFSGTSSSTPHVAGAAALVLEHHLARHGLRLAVEDMERILEYTATDVSGLNENFDPELIYDVGYDDYNGWGLLNAGAAVSLIDEDQKVFHYSRTIVDQSEVECDYEEVCYFQLARGYDHPAFDLPANHVLQGSVIRKEAQISIDLCEYDLAVYDTGYPAKPSAWIRNSASTLWGPPFEESGNLAVFPESGVVFKEPPVISQDGCLLSATLVGYSYVVNEFPWEDIEFDPPLVIPDDLEEIKFAVSVLAEGEGGVVSAGEPLESRQVEIYPNPAAEMVMIEFSADVGSDTDITLHDLNGRVLFTQKGANDSGGRNRVEIPVSLLPSGMYIVRLSTAGELFVEKLIKQ